MSGLTDILGKLIGGLASKWDWLDGKLTEIAVNRLVTRVRSRPHPWSTLNDYISWHGLTDRTYNARLLPAKPIADLPDINKVAALFAAGPVQRECPKSTCLFPAFAQYLTDGFLRTKLDNERLAEDRRRTTSNHDIDLSPLYGRTRDQTILLRSGVGGRLKSQMIGTEEFPPWLYLRGSPTVDPEFAALDKPLGIDHATDAQKQTLFAVGGDRANASPGVTMMNVLFLREHNRLAGQIALAKPDWGDDQLFEVTRNNIIVLFIKIVVEEYINHISDAPFRLRADPRVAWKAKWNRPNWMTAEFSLLYRWHSLVPEAMRWGGESVPGIATILNNALLIRDGLATSFAETSANRATELGLGNTSAALMAIGIEQKAIQQGRDIDMPPYNDYRVAAGGKPAASFANVTPDPALQSRLAALYTTPDRIEFYVGLFAEQRAKNSPLPDLIKTLVAVDAFSQALTNPLLSEHIWGNDANRLLAFTQIGLDNYFATSSLKDILERNSAGLNGRFVGMTRQGWMRD
jgi:prostaglandin-endoperoxide synthase 2